MGNCLFWMALIGVLTIVLVIALPMLVVMFVTAAIIMIGALIV